jgi:putative transposase
MRQPVPRPEQVGTWHRSDDHSAASGGAGVKATPVRSPQSNGIAEAFVKTFKRDYVRLSAKPDATALLAELDRWFEDDN